MADVPANEPVGEELPRDQTEEKQGVSPHGASPRGAFIFVLLLITAYGLYFVFEWINIVLVRGGA